MAERRAYRFFSRDRPPRSDPAGDVMSRAGAKGMKITRVEKPLPPPAAAIWHGTSIDGSRNLQWFYWPRHWLHVREQDEINPRCWMNVDPPPGAKRAVLKAIRR